MKVIKFTIDIDGLCHNAFNPNHTATKVPDNWDDMTEDEQEEYAKECFYEHFGWGFYEEEINDDKY